MTDDWWTVRFANGTGQDVFGTPVVDKTGAVLTITEHFGVTGGIKDVKYFSMANVASWERRPR